MMNSPEQPHQGQPTRARGEPLERAKAAVIMLHGRGATAEDILSLLDEIVRPGFIPEGFAFLAPQAAGNTWYPRPFTAPTAMNEPWLSSALHLVGELVTRLEQAGIPPERTILLGFSQGGCLALEFAARNARRYGGLVGLSSGLIGADEEPRPYRGSLAGTPVYMGCSDMDPHIPRYRLQQTADTLKELGGEVTLRIYPRMGHTVNSDEIAFVREMMSALIPANSKSK